MRYLDVKKVCKVEGKEVEDVLGKWRNGSISKSDLIEIMFFELGLSDGEIKGIEELEVNMNSMVYNVCKSRGLKRGIDIRNNDKIEKSNRNGNELDIKYMEFLDSWVSSKKSMKLNEVVIGLCLFSKKSEVYCRKIVKKYEKLKGINFIKSR